MRKDRFLGLRVWANALSHLAPDMQLERVEDLSLERLHALRIRGLLLDLDCTLKDYHAAEIPERVLDWMTTLAEGGIRLCLFSNGTTGKIERFAKELGIPFVAQAFKPLPFGCRVGLKKLGLRRSEVAVVGDQLFADILAGRLGGLYTILVRPTSPLEPWFTRLKRPLERRYLGWWNSVARP